MCFTKGKMKNSKTNTIMAVKKYHWYGFIKAPPFYGEKCIILSKCIIAIIHYNENKYNLIGYIFYNELPCYFTF